MLRNVFTRTLDDNLRSVIWWVSGSAVLTLGLVWMYPFIRDSDEMTDLLEQMPPAMMAAFGVDPATFLTGAGYLSAQLFAFIGPAIIVGYAVGLGAALTAGDENDGTLDMLLSAPISRTHVVLSKLGASAVLISAIPTAMVFILLAMNGPVGLRVSVQGIVAVGIGLWLLGVVFLGVAAVTGSFSGKPGLARGVGFFAAVLAWFISVFAPLFDRFEIPSRVSPFTWYIGENPLIDLWSVGFVWLSATSIVLGTATVWLFARRDIATELAVLPETAITPRRSKHVAPRSSFLLRSVAGKTAWDRRFTVFLWAAGISALLLVTFAAWPAMSSNAAALEALIGAMPTEMFAIFGMTNPEMLATPAGFVSSRAYLNIGPLIIIIFSIGGVSSLVLKEERSGVLDMVLSNPIRRRAVLLEKVTTLAAVAGVIALILIGVGLIANEIWDTNLKPLHIVGANVGLVLLGMFFGGVTLALWSVLESGGAAVGITAGIAIVMFFLNGLATVVSPIASLRPLSPFYWYLGDTAPLARGIQATYLLLLLGGVLGTAIATWRFETRDLAS